MHQGTAPHKPQPDTEVCNE